MNAQNGTAQDEPRPGQNRGESDATRAGERSDASASAGATTPAAATTPPTTTPPAKNETSPPKGGTVVVRMVAGEALPGGRHARPWPYRIGPEALPGLSGKLKLCAEGTEVSAADAALLVNPKNSAAVGGRLFEIVAP